jgi:hypothetical protein
MQIVTCQVGGSLRLGEGARIVIHGRQGARIALSAWAPAGTELILGGVAMHPVSGKGGVWRYLFSLCGLRRFRLGEYEVQVWLPGELVAQAADCADRVHFGIGGRLQASPLEYRPPAPARSGAFAPPERLPTPHAADGRAQCIGGA